MEYTSGSTEEEMHGSAWQLYSFALSGGMDSLFHSIDVFDGHTNGMITRFVVPQRYTDLRFISAGGQGIVVSAHDSDSKYRVAIKKLKRPFQNVETAKRAYREFILLSSIEHPNIIKMLSVFTQHNSIEEFVEFYIVMECFPYSLHHVTRTTKLDHKTLSFFVYQMLCAIKHHHGAGIVHIDLKPYNIVVNDRTCELKVLDFGLARAANLDPKMFMTDYVATRYYRAPEIILGIPYDDKADVWSIGCIMAEMMRNIVLFMVGNQLEQWNIITRILGAPFDAFLQRLPVTIASYIRQRPSSVPYTMDELFPDDVFLYETELPENNLTANNCRALIGRMLEIHPQERCSIVEALDDPYVRLWNRDHEVNAPHPQYKYDERFERIERSLPEWKDLLFKAIMQFGRDNDVFGIKSISVQNI